MEISEEKAIRITNLFNALLRAICDETDDEISTTRIFNAFGYDYDEYVMYRLRFLVHFKQIEEKLVHKDKS